MGGNLQPLCHPREKEQRGPGSKQAPRGTNEKLDLPGEEEEQLNSGAHKTGVSSGSPPNPPRQEERTFALRSAPILLYIFGNLGTGKQRAFQGQDLAGPNQRKDDQKEVLMHSKPHTLPSLPLSIRYAGPAIEPEVEWTPNATWADLIH
jgi:hypothetical protein